MNEMQKDNFDMLISAAVVQCVHHDADNLSSVDTSDVPDTSRLYKKVMRNLPGSRRTAVKAIVTLALAAALLALTACACLPEIRDYVWGVVTEWYGDYFSVSFVPEPTTTEESETISPEIEPPICIEQIAILAYLPDGYIKKDEMSNSSQYIANFYYNDKWVFVFGQCLADESNSLVDGDDLSIVYVNINNNEAILTETCVDDVIYYNLIWQEGCYRYSLYGTFESLFQLIKIAENVAIE